MQNHTPLTASGEQALPLDGSALSLAILRELTPNGQRLIQPLALQALPLSAFAAERELLPAGNNEKGYGEEGNGEGGSRLPLRFLLPGAWNLESILLTHDARFSSERRDNGDLWIKTRAGALAASGDPGTPATLVSLTVEHRLAGQSVRQTV